MTAWDWRDGDVGSLIAKIYKPALWGDENVLKLFVMMIVHLCEYTINCGIVYVKWTNHISLKLLKKDF